MVPTPSPPPPAEETRVVARGLTGGAEEADGRGAWGVLVLPPPGGITALVGGWAALMEEDDGAWLPGGAAVTDGVAEFSL